MKKGFIFLFVLVYVSLISHSCAVAEGLPVKEKIFSLINSAVFEVVVKKPEKDSLSYERPLPMDLVPYSIRTDKYFSIGTAFAIGHDQFVSAAHVMNLGTESQYGEVFLRDRGGNVYQIDNITKYSDNRDFVVFSLKNKKVDVFFQVNNNPKIGMRVYAVGNALGEGIVVRDGLYTSDTPEEEEGQWKWMRFSAAASPGNSGGPLLDSEGNVVGLVLGKSENENLNYALPIGEILRAENNKATCNRKVKYILDNMDITEIDTFKKEISLPKSYDELNHTLITSFREFSRELLNKFLTKNKEYIFPYSNNSSSLLHSIYSAVFPHIIIKADDGNWDAFYPSEIKRAELGNNGYLRYGGMINTLFLYLRKPDDITTDKFYNDSKLFMDLVLKGIYLYRGVGGEKVKITSFGNAAEEYTFKDSFGRKWIVRIWNLEYSDERVVVFLLPVPGGFAGMLKIGQTELINGGYIPDMKVIANFIYISYYGTLEQWSEFLRLKDILPDIFSQINITFSYGKSFAYKSNRLTFSYSDDMMSITKKSDLKLLTSYFKEHGRVIWDVAGIVAGEDINRSTAIGIFRKTKPAPEVNDSFHSEWDSLINKKFPYNRSSFFKEGITAIKTVHSEPGISSDASILYAVSYEREGNIEDRIMLEGIERFDKQIKVYEK